MDLNNIVLRMSVLFLGMLMITGGAPNIDVGGRISLDTDEDGPVPVSELTRSGSSITIEGVDGAGEALQMTVDQGTSYYNLSHSGSSNPSFSVITSNGYTINCSVASGNRLRIDGLRPGRASIRITETGSGDSRYIGVRVRTAAGKNPVFPDYVAIGSVSEDTTGDLAFWRDFHKDDRNKRMDIRYIYINGGPFFGWRKWSNEDGGRAIRFIQESLKLGMIPFFVFYNIPDGGESYWTDLQHMHNMTYMEAYYDNLKFFLDICRDYGENETIGIVLEPDLIGYMMQNSGKTPDEIMALVNASYSIGVLNRSVDPAFPNTLRGLVKSINYLIDKTYPHAEFGWQFNLWSHPGPGIPQKGLMRATDTMGMTKGRLFISKIANETADYYLNASIKSYNASFISIDKYGLDGAAWNHQDDPANSTWFWNSEHWNNYLLYCKRLHQRTRLPVILWQIPVGHINVSQEPDPYSGGLFQPLGNKWREWEDSAPTYFFGDKFKPGSNRRWNWFTANRISDPKITNNGIDTVIWDSHMSEVRDAGITCILFGAGVGDSTDGVGSPPSDDYWWITKVQRYYKNLIQLPPTVKLRSPSGGDVLTVGRSCNITWTTNGGNGTLKLDLDYSFTGRSGPWIPIARDEIDDGSFEWLVPDTPSNDCFMRITLSDSAVPPRIAMDQNSLSFSIRSPPISVIVTSPSGGENWTIGDRHNITWNASGGLGDLTVDIEYSKEGPDGPWMDVARNEPDDGLFEWEVPDTPSENCRVRVTVTDSSAAPQSLSNMSMSSFTISRPVLPPPPPAVTLLSPNGGEIWSALEQREVLWEAHGGSGPLLVDLSFSTEGPDGPWIPIADDEENDGSFSWTVLDSPSDSCFIRVEVRDPLNGHRFAVDVSNASFSIIRQEHVEQLVISVLSPNGGENWTSGSVQVISWSSKGGQSPLTVKLEYSPEGRSGPWLRIPGSFKGTGAYNWRVPVASSGEVYVRATVTDSSEKPLEAFDTSDSAFTIWSVPESVSEPVHVVLISPNGGENWSVGDSREIVWEVKGGVFPLIARLEYSTEGIIGPWKFIAEIVADKGIFSWFVPDEPSRNCLIKIIVWDGSFPSLVGSDTSESSFTIFKQGSDQAMVSGMVRGFVLDTNRAPISNAVVIILRDGEIVKEARTSQNGSYNILLEKGSYIIAGYAEGYKSSAVTEISLDTTSVVRLDIVLERKEDRTASGSGLRELAIVFLVLLLISFLLNLVFLFHRKFGGSKVS